MQHHFEKYILPSAPYRFDQPLNQKDSYMQCFPVLTLLHFHGSERYLPTPSIIANLSKYIAQFNIFYKSDGANDQIVIPCARQSFVCIWKSLPRLPHISTALAMFALLYRTCPASTHTPTFFLPLSSAISNAVPALSSKERLRGSLCLNSRATLTAGFLSAISTALSRKVS